MFQKYKYNKELSEMVCNLIVEKVEKKACYDNVASVVFKNLTEVDNGDWEIAYGFWAIDSKLWARHCFFITKNNEVVDPTAPLFSKETDYVFFKKMCREEYMMLLEENNYKSCLTLQLKKVELEFQKEMFKCGAVCIG